ncbi:MAG: glutathione peroxidase [Phycisphaerales bacterium]
MACGMCRIGIGLALAVAAAVGAASIASSEAPASEQTDSPYVLGHTMPLLDGTEQDLASYKGEVVLIVNTASRCGLTPQYKDLQSLYEARKDDGFVVLGFPANNFMGQEPGTDKQIAEFCAQNYGVTFPMFSKISVKGDDIAPLYKQLTSQPSPVGGEIQWNFDKFLVDRSGNVVARFSPRTRVTDEAFQTKLGELLGRDG